MLLALALWAGAAAAGAPAAGSVTHVSGALFAQGADGRAKALALGSTVATGDTLVSGSGTYAQVTFADQGTLILKPDTQVVINAYASDTARPTEGRAEFTLYHGGVRIASGAIARASADHQQLRTPLGVIRGANATYVIEYAPESPGKVAALQRTYLAAASTEMTLGMLSDAQPLQLPAPPLRVAQVSPPPGSSGLPAGLYVQVIDGMINLSNGGGSQNFAAGQFGYTPNFSQPPVVVPANPGLKFTPPPTFSTPVAQGSGATGKSGTVDCEVR